MNLLLVPQLKKLASIDTEIRALMQSIESKSNQVTEIDHALSGVTKYIETLHAEKIEAKKRVDEQELESQLLKDEEAHARNTLDNVHSHKEYEAQHKELLYINEKRQLLDDVIIKVWHDLEHVEKKIATELPEYLTRKESLLQEKQTLQNELATLTTKLDQKERERLEIAKTVPQEWNTKYNRMRLRVDDPIVPLSETHCSACYYGIPKQELTNLKRDALIICRNCFRFVYQPDTQTPEMHAQQ